MRHIVCAGLAGLAIASCGTAARAADPPSAPDASGPPACDTCTSARGPACEPACKATWDEKKSSKTKYSLKCEHACARDRDSWHAPPPECRRCPPSGSVYVKKRLYKTDGEPKVEKVPKYEVTTVPAEPCNCAACRGHGPLCWPTVFPWFH